MRLSWASWGAFLGLLLLCGSRPVDGEDCASIGVSISGESVSLTCLGANLQCQKQRGKRYENQSQPLDLTAEGEAHGHYACRHSESGIRYLYLKVKVCESCVELSLGLVAGVVLADLLLTLAVLLVVYRCSKNRMAGVGGRAAAGGSQGRPRGHKAESPPPVPDPDYEPIRKGQREVYAGLQPSRAF